MDRTWTSRPRVSAENASRQKFMFMRYIWAARRTLNNAAQQLGGSFSIRYIRAHVPEFPSPTYSFSSNPLLSLLSSLHLRLAATPLHHHGQVGSFQRRIANTFEHKSAR